MGVLLKKPEGTVGATWPAVAVGLFVAFGGVRPPVTTLQEGTMLMKYRYFSAMIQVRYQHPHHDHIIHPLNIT